MAAAPTVTPLSTTDNSPIGTVGNAGGNYQGLIYQQLQIITILLREGFNLPREECSTLVQQTLPATSTTGAL